MTYRDDNEGLRVRVAALEDELADAKRQIADLSGRSAVAEPSASNDRWLGAPAEFVLERPVAFTPNDATYVAVGRQLSELSPGGHVSQIGRGLVFRHPLFEVTVTPTDEERAAIRLRAKFGHYRVLPIMFSLTVALLAMPVLGATFGPLALLALPLIALIAFWPLRALTAFLIRKSRERLAASVAGIAAASEREARPQQVRVATPPVADAAEPLEEEQAEEAARRNQA